MLSALDHEGRVFVIAGPRYVRARADRSHSRQGPQPVGQALDELDGRRGLPIPCKRNAKANGQHAFRLKSGIGFQQAHKAAQEKAGSDQQNHSQTDLSDDEHSMRTQTSSGARRPGRFLKRLVEIDVDQA